MFRPLLIVSASMAAFAVAGGMWILAQSSNEPIQPPLPPPPRPYPEQEEEQAEPAQEEKKPDLSIVPESDRPWGLTAEFLEGLAGKAEDYREYALRFTCLETVRTARYDMAGEASDERVRRYAYLLERDARAESLSEYRQKVRRNGKVAAAQSKDDEPFPPAYGWSFLFSRIHQPYFAYRELGRRFDGFDWVRDIQFKGALPWTDGKDIRQWEGIAVVDAATLTPLEVHAEPSGQKERVRAMFDRWTRAFNLIGIRLAPRPFGYRCRVQFLLRKDELTFPTLLRYDTFRAIGSEETIPWKASIREYADYRFFKTETSETPSGPVSR